MDIITALEPFTHLNDKQRAVIIQAYELAPETPVSDEEYDDYLNSLSGKTWWSASGLYMEPASYQRRPEDYVTLESAANYESAPTKGEILKALARAEKETRA